MKKMKKWISCVFVLMLCFFVFPSVSPFAKSKGVPTEKKVIYQGEEYRFFVIGNVTFKNSNKKLCTIDKKGNLKALKPGKVVITAMSGKNEIKRYEILIKEKPTKKKITVEFMEYQGGLIAKLTNKNKSAVKIDAKLIYKDGDGYEVDSVTDFISMLDKNAVTYLKLRGTNKEYETTDFDLKVERSNFTSGKKAIRLGTQKLEDHVLSVEVFNEGKVKLSTIALFALFYDEDGQLVGGSRAYPSCYNGKSKDTVKFYPEYGTNPTSYKVFVTEAHYYK